MFREGRHVEKNKRCSEKLYGFVHRVFIVFLWKIAKKTVENGIVHKNRQKSMFGTAFFCKKSIFKRFLGFLWVPGGVPGRPGSSPESFIFSLIFSCAWKLAQMVPGETPGRPKGSPQASPGYHFKSIFGSILHVKQPRKMSKMLKKTRKNHLRN